MGLGILSGEQGVQATYWAPQLWGLTPERWAPLAGLKTGGTYCKTVRNWYSALEKHTSKLAYSGSPHGSITLKTSWDSSWLAGTDSVHNPVHTGHLLWPLLHQHCSPLEQRLLWPREVCTHRGNGLDSASEQGGGNHYQCMSPWVHAHTCMHILAYSRSQCGGSRLETA